MNHETITLELQGPTEAYALAKAINSRLEALQDSHRRSDVIEFFTLHQISVRMKPQVDAFAEQAKQKDFGE